MSIAELSEQEQIRRQLARAAARVGNRPLSGRPVRGDRHGRADRRGVLARKAELLRHIDRGAHPLAPYHGQRVVFRAAGPYGQDTGLHQARRSVRRRSRSDALQQGLQEAARHRRHRRRARIRVRHQNRRAVGPLQGAEAAEQVAAAAADRQGEGRQSVRTRSAIPSCATASATSI